MSSRTFTRWELQDWGLPSIANGVMENEIVEIRRWVSVNRLVFRAPDDDKFYEVFYEEGLTENQYDVEWFDEDVNVGTEVSLQQVTVERWLPA